MRRLYYLTENINSAEKLSDCLHAKGIADRNFHVYGKDKAQIVKRHLKATTPLYELDIIRSGERGTLAGFFVGAIVIAVLMAVTNFAQSLHWGWIVGGVALFTLFGAWIGGLIGVSTKNYKTKKFQNNIEAGQFLLIIDVNMSQSKLVKAIVAEQFDDIKRAGEDTTIVSPFETAES
jgi:hypothetical protein